MTPPHTKTEPAPRDRRPHLSAVAACLLAMLFSPSVPAQPEGNGPPPAKVIFDNATLETVNLRRAVIGQIRAAAVSMTAAQEPGLVQAITVEPGDAVSKDQAIVQLDTTLIDLEIERTRAELESLDATLAERTANADFLERDLERVERLNTRGSATDREVDQVRTDAEAARARFRQARAEINRTRAELASLEERRRDMTIRAPFDGAVVQKMTEIGQWLSQGDVVAELVRMDKVDVYVDVPERFVNALSEPGATVQITVDALGRTFESSDLAIIAQGDRLARTFPLRIRLDNQDQQIKPAMSVTASVPSGESGERLTIAKDAVLRNDAGPFVYINQNGTSAPRQIEILFATEDRFAIRPGPVPPGTQTVVVGNERLFPGQPLQNVQGQIPPQAAEANPRTRSPSPAPSPDQDSSDNKQKPSTEAG